MSHLHYVYISTNEKTGEYYIGKRSAPTGKTPEEDPYMGSGVVFKKKYKCDRSAWTKKVIAVFDTAEEAYCCEAEVLGTLWADDDKCLNLIAGGLGGDGEFLKEKWQDPAYREAQIQAIKKKWQDPKRREAQGHIMRERVNEKWQDPEYREAQTQNGKRQMTARWQDPKYREAHAQRMKERWQDHRRREAHALSVREGVCLLWESKRAEMKEKLQGRSLIKVTDPQGAIVKTNRVELPTLLSQGYKLASTNASVMIPELCVYAVIRPQEAEALLLASSRFVYGCDTDYTKIKKAEFMSKAKEIIDSL